MKKITERSLSAGLIRVNPMHSGCEDFLMQRMLFKGINCELIQRVRGRPRISLPRLVRKPRAEKLHANAKLRVIGG